MARDRLTVAVRIECASWRRAWPSLATEVRKMLLAVSRRSELERKAQGEVAVVLTDDTALKRLNARFRGKDQPTNVLSFPDAAVPLGGIALAYETVDDEAREQKKDIVSHAKHLVLHGFLHLLGYDHQSSKQARLMEGLETAILSDMGIPDPYLIRTKTRA